MVSLVKFSFAIMNDSSSDEINFYYFKIKDFFHPNKDQKSRLIVSSRQMFHSSHSKNFQREIYRFGHFWTIFGGSVVNEQHVRLIANRTFSTCDYRIVILIIKSDKLFKTYRVVNCHDLFA